ncbi:hypothetical protein ACO0QE_000217 [Hanseniaspora vineae]
MPQKTEYDPFLHYADHEPPIDTLTLSQDILDQLSPQEELYAHYTSKASHAGIRIVLRQVSHESEGIFDMIMDNHKHIITHCAGQYPQGPQPHDRRYYLEYCSQFLNNLGNYTFFGDSKFIPQCSREYWYELLQMRGVNTRDKVDVHGGKPIVSLVEKLTYKDLIETVFFINELNVKLGFPNENNHSSYYYGTVSNEDMQFLVENVYQKYEIMPENTRVWREEGTVWNEVGEVKRVHFKILVASKLRKNETEEYPRGKFTVKTDTSNNNASEAKISKNDGNACSKHSHKTSPKDAPSQDTHNTNTSGTNVGVAGAACITCEFIFGDHSPQLTQLTSYLQKALAYTTAPLQQQMLSNYLSYYKTGSFTHHKTSQSQWLQIQPSSTVEYNSGFIESYRDPSGLLGEFQGIVALQNKQRTQGFRALAKHAPDFIKTLPWSQDFENDEFNAPDFTALEVLTFVGSGIPVGVNLPNYDDIKEKHGCKNVALSNVLDLDSRIKTRPSFILDEQVDEFKKYASKAFNIQVGLHELIGHGTGKFLTEEKSEGNTEKYNFDIKNPPLGLDNKPITTHYLPDETWFTKFGNISGAYEECRAECISMYLLPNRKVLQCFGLKDKATQDKVIFNGYLLMARSGLNALQYWSPESNQIMQPHMAARFIVFKQFLQNSKFCKIVLNENETDFHIELNAELIESVGVQLISDLLRHLHIYRCSGDVERGTEYYNKVAQVPEELLKLRPIVLSKKLPRKQIIQGNTFLNSRDTTDDEENGVTNSNSEGKPHDNSKTNHKQKSNKVSKNKIIKGKKIYIKYYPETSLGMLDSFAERNY